MATKTVEFEHDLIWGSKAIAQEINRTVPQTFYMLEEGRFPARKVGGLWCASREALRRHPSVDSA